MCVCVCVVGGELEFAFVGWEGREITVRFVELVRLFLMSEVTELSRTWSKNLFFSSRLPKVYQLVTSCKCLFLHLQML